MNRFKIGTRLAAAFTLVTLLLAVAIGVGHQALADMHSQADRTLAVDAAIAANAAEVARLALQARRFEKDTFINIGDAERVASYRDRWVANRQALDSALADGASLADEPALAAGYTEAARGLEAYAQGYADVYRAIRRGDITDTGRANEIFGAYKESIYTLDEAAGAINAAARERMANAGAAIEASYRGARNQLWLFAAAAIAAALICSLLITRSITRPLRYAVATTQRIARGDLRQPIEVNGRDEPNQVLAALAEMNQSLKGLAYSISSAGQAVDLGASEIASGNDELSSRTQQQAANIQESAASLEQLTSTVAQNARNAQQANELTSQVRTQAGGGREVAERAVDSMNQIDESSRRVTDIISLIDDIAFQTNLLALNASVEAARAGEHGLGFAVVADEVRKLAGRSAEAAREIKTLIDDSASKIAAGSAEVKRCDSALQEIVDSVNKVDAVVAEIATASQQQSAGIDQVNLAVSQMDNATQQNASLVEQAAAASTSLAEQAKTLRAQIGFFSFDAPTASTATAAPAAAPTPAATAAPATRASQTAPTAPAPAAGSDAEPSTPPAAANTNRATSPKSAAEYSEWATF